MYAFKLPIVAALLWSGFQVEALQRRDILDLDIPLWQRDVTFTPQQYYRRNLMYAREALTAKPASKKSAPPPVAPKPASLRGSTLPGKTSPPASAAAAVPAKPPASAQAPATPGQNTGSASLNNFLDSHGAAHDEPSQSEAAEYCTLLDKSDPLYGKGVLHRCGSFLKNPKQYLADAKTHHEIKAAKANIKETHAPGRVLAEEINMQLDTARKTRLAPTVELDGQQQKIREWDNRHIDDAQQILGAGLKVAGALKPRGFYDEEEELMYLQIRELDDDLEETYGVYRRSLKQDDEIWL